MPWSNWALRKHANAGVMSSLRKTRRRALWAALYCYPALSLSALEAAINIAATYISHHCCHRSLPGHDLLAGGSYYSVLRSRSRGGPSTLTWRGAIVFVLGVSIATLGPTINWLFAGRLHSVAYVAALWGRGFSGPLWRSHWRPTKAM